MAEIGEIEGMKFGQLQETPLTIVVATLDPAAAWDKYISSWLKHATGPIRLLVVWSGHDGKTTWEPENITRGHGLQHQIICLTSREMHGVVWPYMVGVKAIYKAASLFKGFEPVQEIVCCLHDDVEILEPGWDQTVKEVFYNMPNVGHAGFGGAMGVGSADIYQAEYNPMQLARIGFASNMRDAESHGRRTDTIEYAACFDGFSLIGRMSFLLQAWMKLNDLGLIHHAYDTAMGLLAIRGKWRSVIIPVKCHHQGGVTAVLSPKYQAWAEEKNPGQGDAGFWQAAHRIVYEEFKDELPVMVDPTAGNWRVGNKDLTGL